MKRLWMVTGLMLAGLTVSYAATTVFAPNEKLTAQKLNTAIGERVEKTAYGVFSTATQTKLNAKAGTSDLGLKAALITPSFTGPARVTSGPNDNGIIATSEGMYGVLGTSVASIGVGGESETYIGVSGMSLIGKGVSGFSATGVGGEFTSTDGNAIEAYGPVMAAGTITAPAFGTTAPDGQRWVMPYNSVTFTDTPQKGMVFTNNSGVRWYNGTAWEPVAGKSALLALSDVSITTPITNDFIRYNGTAWVADATTYTTVTGHTAALSAADLRFNNMSSQLQNLKVSMLAAGFPSIPTRVTPATANYTSTTNSFLLNYTSPVGTSLAYVYNGGTSTAMTTGVDSAPLTAPAANAAYGYTVTATKTSTGYTATDSGTFTYTTPVLTTSGTGTFGTGLPVGTAVFKNISTHNTGMATATTFTREIVSGGDSQFTVASGGNCSTSLAAGATCFDRVQFLATDAVAKTATFRTKATGSLATQADVALSGTGFSGVAAAQSWSFEQGVSCGSVSSTTNFSLVYGTTAQAICNDTTHAFAGSYDMKLVAGGSWGVRYILPTAVDTLWVQFSVYRDSATAPTSEAFFTLSDANSTDVLYIRQDATTRLWRVMKTVTTAGSYPATTAPAGQTYSHIRLKVVRSDTVGSIEMWVSSDGTTWNKEITQTGLDTNNGGTTPGYSRMNFGKNNGSNIVYDTYFDNIMYWSTDPGW